MTEAIGWRLGTGKSDTLDARLSMRDPRCADSLTGFDETLFELRHRPIQDRGARDEEQIAIRLNAILVAPEHFAQSPLRPIPTHGDADGSGGGNDANASLSDRPRFDGRDRRAFAPLPPNRESAGLDPLAEFSYRTNLAGPTKVVFGEKAHGEEGADGSKKTKG
jgi:hypothetical protein